MSDILRALHSRYLDQPYEISLETLALCNARCTFCPYPTLERKGVRMPDELIETLIAQMATLPLPFLFSPFKVNEPLLDKRTLPLMRRMNRDVPHAHMRLFTNGSPLTGSVIDSINNTLVNVVHVWVSLNSHDPAQYKEIMGLEFEKTAKRLDDLHETGCKFKVVVSKVREAEPFNFHNWRDNIASMSYPEFWASGPNEVQRRDLEFVEYVRNRWPGFEPVLIKRDGWLGYVEPNSPDVPDIGCVRWFELSILATGKVSLCCMDGKGDFSIGDINTHSLLDVYNAPFWRERRERLISRRDIHPCSTCTY